LTRLQLFQYGDVLKTNIRKVGIYHNSLWAKYKGAIFTRIFALQDPLILDVAFVHVAETSDKRAILGPPDLSYHTYPYRLLFRDSSDHVRSSKLAAAVVKDILRNAADLVVIPGYHRVEYWAMLLTCILLGRKRAVFCDSTAYDNPKVGLKETAKAFFFRHCHGVFCYGTRSKEYIESYGVDPRRIYSPCQAAALPHTYNPAAILQRYAARSRVDAESPTYLFAGRLAPEKGIYDLLEAFRRIHERLPKATLVIAGSGSEKDSLQSQASRWGLEESIIFLGNQSPEQLGTLFENSTALVLPSHREPWGLVVNESLSYGCPVVVSSICGCTPELVQEAITGYVFPSSNIETLFASMLQVIELSKNRIDTAKRCIEVVSHYTPQRAASEILRGCQNILGAPLQSTPTS
jgi:glycosyltransferase involved in cell wall biosynthesis